MPTAKGYTGQYADVASSGLDYYNARYYDPLIGQFASADSAADGLNRYGYVAGNPETATDPSGHRVCMGANCDGGGGGGSGDGGGGGGSGGGCASENQDCGGGGCHTNCGGGHGGSGHGGGGGSGGKPHGGCHGGCNAVTTSPSTPACNEDVCPVGQHQTGGLFSLMGYDTSMLEFIGVAGINAFLELLNQAESRLWGLLATGGGLDALPSGLIGLVCGACGLLAGGAETAAFILYIKAELSNISAAERDLKQLRKMILDDDSVNYHGLDNLVIDVSETQASIPPWDIPFTTPGRQILEAEGLWFGRLHVMPQWGPGDSVIPRTPQ